MNRRERRKLEKQFGLMKQYQNGTKEERAEIRARRREMGKKLHQQHLENVENSLREQKEKREAQMIQNWIKSGKTEEEAKAIINENYRIQQERIDELEAREQKRKMKKHLKI